MKNRARTLTLAHSPDSDDAFMFWALAKGRIESDGLEFEHILSDIQGLNQAALVGRYDVTAISVHAYPYIARDYMLLNVGASVGDGYGPMLVARKAVAIASLREGTVAIPGALTTAALVLRLAVPELRTHLLAFDRILGAVARGEVDAGLIIHEGQITYAKQGLHLVLDLGRWWREETGLPLPLGANAVRRNLGRELIDQVASVIRRSIRYALDHRKEALGYAQDYGRELAENEVDRFVAMYVNDYTLDWGDTGRQAVAELLGRGAATGIVPPVDEIEFAG